MTPYHALTRTYKGLQNVICSGVQVANTSNGKSAATEAIWDTGATNCCITSDLVATLGLLPTGQTMVNGVHGEKQVSVYSIRLTLNNNVSFVIPVTECSNLSDDDSRQILIGMDIIASGDFAVSNFNGQTVMTFRYPSVAKTDYVEEWKASQKLPAPIQVQKVPGRNDACPCGSGKKYKNCHIGKPLPT